MRRVFLATASLCLLVSFVLTAAAQQATTATLSGVVVDQSGAVIPKAKIIATQIATGLKREGQTNGEGGYVLSNLPPGEYEIVVEASGFKKFRLSNLSLQVGQHFSRDIVLAVGDLKEICSDCDWGWSPLVSTASSTVEEVILSKTMQTLPLNG
ncbi:MAG: carboxypeptidase regulatory-like domain-containing protein, partial [Acidobacteria bacterium]|nr:carboxypeptidase regulatory-like domain-containing protein [Acidobacteriota bacterium]